MRSKSLGAPDDSELLKSGLFEALSTAEGDECLWLDCDLASLAENRLEELRSPRGLTSETRARWQALATTEKTCTLAARGSFERCYWLMQSGQRVGTIALSHRDPHRPIVRISSFYVFPEHRRLGIGQRTLARLKEWVTPHDFDLRLETEWTWQKTVRFYLRAGFWVFMWKRELSLFWSCHAPQLKLEANGDLALLFAEKYGQRSVLATAQRKGNTLVLNEDDDASAALSERVRFEATGTFALLLALEGWPLIRSDEEWQRGRYSDAGPPEALAHRIAIWEAYDKDHGFTVKTPVIPGLSYPTWTEYQAQWRKADAP
jgi:GNAT superfamily N-acetyltransferase